VQDERRVHLSLTAEGRKLKARAARIPGCVLAASQCSLAEVQALTQQVQALRQRLAE
jgi:DNA-binding MarR family transcriptional regulator